MKLTHILLMISALLLTFTASRSMAQTAVNFTVNDCNSISHTLFSDLDAGYVVVIVWVMPCASCLSPALSAYSQVQNVLQTNPGTVKYYLVDDYANTSCSTLSSWASGNGISSADAIFSDAAINMSDYGSTGMPKVVVICGSSHSVIFNQNNSLDATAFGKALENALMCASANGIQDAGADYPGVKIYPNPSVNGKTVIDYTLRTASNVKIEIFNTLGEKVMTLTDQHQDAGDHSLDFGSTGLSEGIYIATITTGVNSQSTRFIIGR